MNNTASLIPKINLVSNNHAIITIGNDTCYQSYRSIVAKYEPATGKLTLGQHWDYSSTTIRHLRADFLPYPFNGYSKAQIERAIKDGEIIYDENLI